MKVSGCPGNGLPFAALSHPDKSRIVGERNEAMQRALTFSLSADTLIDGILHSRERRPCPSRTASTRTHTFIHIHKPPLIQTHPHRPHPPLFTEINMRPQGVFFKKRGVIKQSLKLFQYSESEHGEQILRAEFTYL